ncbi:MAG: DUF2065 domain-containing protein [Arenicellales bacterium WSBS_2016_MAG_OTU3]
MLWQDLFAALALVLVIESIMPFVNPERYKQALSMMSQVDDNSLRTLAGVLMAVGLVLLYLIRN